MGEHAEVRSVKYKSRDCYIYVHTNISSGPQPFLIDTGSDISLMPLCMINDDTVINTAEQLSITSFTGNHVKTKGKVNSIIQFGSKGLDVTFQVMPRSYPKEGIIGRDFLEKYKAEINFYAKTINIDGVSILLGVKGQPNPKEVMVNKTQSQTLTIPPRVEQLVQVKLPCDGDHIINARELAPGVLLAGCVVSCDKGITNVAIINSNDHEIQLKEVQVEIEKLSDVALVNRHTITQSEEPTESTSFERMNKLKELVNINTNLNLEDQAAIERLLNEFNMLFYLPGDVLPGSRTVTHHIETGESRPVMMRPYRLPESQKSIINDEIKELLTKDVITPSKSPYNAPLLVVPKKSGPDGKRKYRVVVDFRKLNENTIGDAYPLPQINEILDQLGHSRFFSTLDLASGYHQIHMEPKDQHKTAFSTTFGHYEFKRLPFGLKGAPATFQRLMNHVLVGLQGFKCFVYLDDIVIYGKSAKEHNEKLREVFTRLNEHSLRLQPNKCNFLQQEITYLGHKISEKGIEPDEEKLKCVRDFPVPKNHKQVMSYLGLVNYYRKFIPNFSKISRPINNLLKKNVKFDWSPECQNAFEILREKLLNPPILMMPDFSKPFIITTDASDTAIGAILSQGEIGEDRPCCYSSRSLNDAERNYSTIEKEQLAMVWATNNYRPYVLGRKFTIVTDHKPLQWAFKVKDATSRITRWRLKLEEYEYTIVYKAGKNNTNADALSRIPYHEMVCNVVSTRSKTKQDSQDDSQDKELQPNAQPTVLNDLTEIQTVLKELHDSPIGGHQGFKRTFNKIRALYSWKGMKKDIEKYIKQCETCQKNKEGYNPKQPMVLTTTSTRSFEKLFLDIVGPLDISLNGNTCILTMMDDLTKLAISVALPDQKANTVAKAFTEKFICVYGCPEAILTDQGTNFMSSVMKSVCKLLNVSKINTSAYHPQSNGTLERSHQTLATYLKSYATSAKSDWDEWLPYACFMYNTTPHSSSRYTPYELVFGKQPIIPSSVKKAPAPLYNYDDFSQELRFRLQNSWRKAIDNLKRSKEISKLSYDRTAKQRSFAVGDQVLYRNQTRKGKLDQLWYGPFIITSTDNVNSTIIIKNKEKVVHNNDLKSFNSRPECDPI